MVIGLDSFADNVEKVGGDFVVDIDSVDNSSAVTAGDSLIDLIDLIDRFDRLVEGEAVAVGFDTHQLGNWAFA